ncbi:hypothetical protein ELAC_1473 [Estrella lausannensis]|uniref:Uncharacterized protein n=2 Tax=Estrella lausannensis TaxID=483423 RepID=A0A0H5DQ91_9BACT|nr:hypothetical protein ELAC_1473 [Estrella lausannensis]
MQAAPQAMFNGHPAPILAAPEPMDTEECQGVKRKQGDDLNEDLAPAGLPPKKICREAPKEPPVSRRQWFRKDSSLLLPGEKEDLCAKLERQRPLEMLHGDALSNIRKLVYEGLMTEDQRQEFIRTMENMLQQGLARSAFTLAFLASKNPAPLSMGQEVEFNYYCKGADLGCVDCCFAMGSILHKKHPNGEKSAEVAYYWRVAAALGHTKARFNYALLLLQGIGVEADPVKALKLIEENADILRQPEAEYRLAMELKRGKHIIQDLPRAHKLLLRAVSKGYAEAEYTLAATLFYGEGTEVNKPEACALYKRCADRGGRSAQYSYAVMKLIGDGVEANVEEAIHYLQLSANQDYPSALNALAFRYHTGDGLPKDNQKACDLWRRAADGAKHAKSMLYLGMMYESGEGVESDILKAFEYYAQAYPRAALALDRLNSVMKTQMAKEGYEI